MRLIAISAIALAVLTTSVVPAASSWSAFFADKAEKNRQYAQALKVDCGPSAWRGVFSGYFNDRFIDEAKIYSDQGCFRSERKCRVWQQFSIQALDGGPVRVSSCEPY